MKKIFTLATVLTMSGLLSLAQAADPEKGRALFESPALGGGTTGKSCKSCHAGGKNLGSDLFERKQQTIMGTDKASLAEVINVCIEKPLGGKAIDPRGEEMQDLLAYMQTLVAAKQAAK